jgi:hypothetical protein
MAACDREHQQPSKVNGESLDAPQFRMLILPECYLPETAKASVTPTSSPVGFWAFSGVFFIAVTEDSFIDLTGLVVFPASSSGMDATGWLFALANAAAFALG